jgi:hypothetical protein
MLHGSVRHDPAAEQFLLNFPCLLNGSMQHREPKSEIDDTSMILQGASCIYHIYYSCARGVRYVITLEHAYHARHTRRRARWAKFTAAALLQARTAVGRLRRRPGSRASTRSSARRPPRGRPTAVYKLDYTFGESIRDTIMKKIAALITEYRPGTHADVLISKFLHGFAMDDPAVHPPRVQLRAANSRGPGGPTGRLGTPRSLGPRGPFPDRERAI